MKRPSASSLILFGFSLGILGSVSAAALGSSVFPDVPAGSYFDSAVGEMYAEGIITGYQNGKFGPNDYVTRGQVAVMMQRLRNELLGVSVSSSSRSRSSESSVSSSSSTTSSSTSSSSSTVVTTEAGAFRFTTGSYKGEEDQAMIKVTVTRYGGTKGSVTVDYATENGVATAGNDFTETKGTLTFTDGKSSGSFDVPLVNDTEAEGNHAFLVKLLNPTGGAQVGSPMQATVTIVDDDEGDGSAVDTTNSKGVISFSASQYSIAENISSVVITVNRVGTDGAVSVKFETLNGSANTDYYDQNNGTLDFAAGESSKTFTVNIRDNDGVNGNKTVNLKLSNPTGGASLGAQSLSTLTIVDDEINTFSNGKFKLADEAFDTTEGAVITMVIKRMSGAKGEVTVEYATENTLAKAGEDFTEAKGTLTFKEGEAEKKVNVTVLKDDKDDPRETFKFKLANPTGGAILETPSSATITIE